MRRKIGVIGDIETVIGFGLAGVKDLYIGKTKEENLTNFKKMLDDPEIGIIFVTAPIADELEIDKIKRGASPIVVTIPDSMGRGPKIDMIEKIITKTLGTKVVIRGGE